MLVVFASIPASNPAILLVFALLSASNAASLMFWQDPDGLRTEWPGIRNGDRETEDYDGNG